MSSPYNQEAEQNALSAALGNNTAAKKLVSKLEVSDFGNYFNQAIFAAMAKLVNEGHQIDRVIVSSSLSGNEEFVSKGGTKHLIKVCTYRGSLFIVGHAFIFAHVRHLKCFFSI